MATGQKNISIGTADNEGDGITLREAFRRIRKNFAEIYGDTDSDNLTDTEAVTETNFESHIVEKIQDTIGGMVTGNTETNITVTYDDSDGTLDFVVAADITDVNAGSGLTGTNEDGGAATLNVGAGDGITVNADDIALASSAAGAGLTYTSGVLSVDSIDTAGITDDAVTAAKLNEFDDTLTAATSGDIIVSNGTDFVHATMSGDATIASGGALTIANDVIGYANLADEFTTIDSLSGTAVDWSAAQVFTKTLSAATTLTFSNVSTGMVIDLVITGNYTLTLPSSVKTITGTYDGTVSNLIQLVSTNGSTEQWATISQEAS